jgi:hypothetical protein
MFREGSDEALAEYNEIPSDKLEILERERDKRCILDKDPRDLECPHCNGRIAIRDNTDLSNITFYCPNCFKIVEFSYNEGLNTVIRS